jgi:hypothetical protein
MYLTLISKTFFCEYGLPASQCDQHIGVTVFSIDGTESERRERVHDSLLPFKLSSRHVPTLGIRIEKSEEIRTPYLFYFVQSAHHFSIF